MSNTAITTAIATATANTKSAKGKGKEKHVAPAIARALAINSARNVAAHDADYTGNAKGARIDLMEEEALDGKGIVKRGAFASNAYGATRGAAQAINAALVKAGNKGMAIADLIEVTAAALPAIPVKGDADKAIKDRAVNKLVEHLKGLFFESDAIRANTSGLAAAILANGYNISYNTETRRLSMPAVTFDGIEWNGARCKQCLGVSATIAAPLLVAMHRKAAKSSK